MPRLHPRLVLALLLAAPTLVSGCAVPRRADPTLARAAASLQFSSSDQDRDVFGRRMRVLLLNGRFDRLDRIADSLRASHQMWSDDSWTLRRYYRESFFGEDSWSEDDWKPVMHQLRVWRETRPRSITAPVALAYGLVGWAWNARGTGVGSTVSKNGWKLMRERIDEARMVLMAARRLPDVCPEWYGVEQSVALGQGWERADYEKLFAEAVAAHPDYAGYYTAKACFLLPRWYGKPGEWEVFATEAAAGLPDSLASRIYAHIVWSQDAYYGNIFQETAVSWPRTRAGFEQMRARFPSSLEILSREAYFSCCAADHETAQRLFAAIGDRVDVAVWKNARLFLRARDWALAPPS